MENSSSKWSNSWEAGQLDMGDLPGMHMQGGNGQKFLSIDHLPESFVERAEGMFPGSISEPIVWDDWEFNDGDSKPA